jgi:hypothetical protein
MKDIGAVNATVATLVNTVTVCTSAVNEKLGPANSTKLELYPVVVSTALVNETVDAVGSGAIVKPAAKTVYPGNTSVPLLIYALARMAHSPVAAGVSGPAVMKVDPPE